MSQDESIESQIQRARVFASSAGLEAVRIFLPERIVRKLVESGAITKGFYQDVAVEIRESKRGSTGSIELENHTHIPIQRSRRKIVVDGRGGVTTVVRRILDACKEIDVSIDKISVPRKFYDRLRDNPNIRAYFGVSSAKIDFGCYYIDNKHYTFSAHEG